MTSVTDDQLPGDRLLSLAECPVCSHLSDVEQSYARWGWDEQTIAFLDAARHLVWLEDDSADGHGAASGTALLRCPECGTLYRYTWASEYLSNGSEDRSELRRLAPAQARATLEDAAYDRLMSWMGLWLSHADAAVRRHAARSLAAHHLAAQNPGMVQTLLQSPDLEVVRGALLLLRDVERIREWEVGLSPLHDALHVLERNADAEIAGAAQYLARLARMRGVSGAD